MTDGEITVRAWFADYPFSTYDGQEFLAPVRKRAEEFARAHPGYRVEIESHPFWEMPPAVARAAARGEAPHLAGYYAADSQHARDAVDASGRPLFTSVEQAVAGRTEILGEPVVLGDLVPAVRDFHTRDGELFSVPVTATTVLLYANTTLLEAAGVDRLPATWAEVEAACRAVARTAPGTASHGITWANDGWLFQQAVAQQGGLLADHDNGRSGRARSLDLTSAELLAWVEWWQGLHEAGHYLCTGQRSDWGGAFEAFAGQRVAFVVDSSKAAEELVRAGERGGFAVGLGAVPHNPRVPDAGNFVSGDSLWLADGLDERTRDAALAFTQYLINPRNAGEWHRLNGFVPVTGAAYDLLVAQGWFDRYPHRRVASERLAAAHRSPAALGPLVGDLAGIGEVLTEAMEDVLLRGDKPAERFALATAAAQRLLDAYEAAHGR
ncbi:extracellular solute-binding protein [Streptomyces sp. NPDC053048]|uniref:extracellular solute-binding protein n=1 Tax=Streptomyces sp. NPDC053048 TaxID=3365694 RepID=UPI0037D69986